MTSSISMSTRSVLIERLRSGSDDAYRELLEWIGPQVFRWCQGLGLNHADAEEVFQDCFVAVFQNLHRFEKNVEQGGFRAWLWTIVYHKSIDLHRKGTMYNIGDDVQLILDGRLPEPDDSERNELLWAVCRIVKTQFTETSWQVFWSTTVEGRSAVDVAEEVGMSTVAVRKAKSRVLAAIRNEFAIWEGAGQR